VTHNVSDIYRTIATLEDEAARLRRVAAGTEVEAATTADLTRVGLTLPPDVIVPKPADIESYLRVHPDLVRIVREMAVALVEEFRSERSEIELALYQDPEIDDRYLTFNVRLPTYDEMVIPRLRSVWEQVDRRFPPAPEWVQVTTDYRPIQ
jgi:hypothetical protein